MPTINDSLIAINSFREWYQQDDRTGSLRLSSFSWRNKFQQYINQFLLFRKKKIKQKKNHSKVCDQPHKCWSKYFAVLCLHILSPGSSTISLGENFQLFAFPQGVKEKTGQYLQYSDFLGSALNGLTFALSWSTDTTQQTAGAWGILWQWSI